MLEKLLTEKKAEGLFYTSQQVIDAFGEQRWGFIKEDAAYSGDIILPLKYKNKKGRLVRVEEAVLKEQVNYSRRVRIKDLADAFGIKYDSLEEVADWTESLCPIEIEDEWCVSLCGTIELFKNEIKRADAELPFEVTHKELEKKGFVVSKYLDCIKDTPKTYSTGDIINFYRAVMFDLNLSAARDDGRISNPNFTKIASDEYGLEKELKDLDEEIKATDGVHYLLRQMGTIELLSRDEEKNLAHSIELERIEIFKELLNKENHLNDFIIKRIYEDVGYAFGISKEREDNFKYEDEEEEEGNGMNISNILFMEEKEIGKFKKIFQKIDRNDVGGLETLFLGMSEKKKFASGYYDDLLTFAEYIHPEISDDPVFAGHIKERDERKEELKYRNYRLVFSIAKRYTKFCNHLDILDLFQEGVDKYDYKKGYKFSTYATWWIRQAMTRTMADSERTIRIPVHMIETINKFLRTGREFFKEHGRDPTDEEAAHKMKIPASKVRKIKKISQGTISIFTPTGDDSDSEIADFIEDKKTDPHEDTATNQIIYDQVVDSLENSGRFKGREISILKARSRGETLEEIGARFRVTRERIRQIEAKALRKARAYFKKKGFMVSEERVRTLDKY